MARSDSSFLQLNIMRVSRGYDRIVAPSLVLTAGVSFRNKWDAAANTCLQSRNHGRTFFPKWEIIVSNNDTKFINCFTKFNNIIFRKKKLRNISRRDFARLFRLLQNLFPYYLENLFTYQVLSCNCWWMTFCQVIRIDALHSRYNINLFSVVI